MLQREHAIFGQGSKLLGPYEAFALLLRVLDLEALLLLVLERLARDERHRFVVVTARSAVQRSLQGVAARTVSLRHRTWSFQSGGDSGVYSVLESRLERLLELLQRLPVNVTAHSL